MHLYEGHHDMHCAITSTSQKCISHLHLPVQICHVFVYAFKCQVEASQDLHVILSELLIQVLQHLCSTYRTQRANREHCFSQNHPADSQSACREKTRWRKRSNQLSKLCSSLHFHSARDAAPCRGHPWTLSRLKSIPAEKTAEYTPFSLTGSQTAKSLVYVTGMISTAVHRAKCKIRQ